MGKKSKKGQSRAGGKKGKRPGQGGGKKSHQKKSPKDESKTDEEAAAEVEGMEVELEKNDGIAAASSSEAVEEGMEVELENDNTPKSEELLDGEEDGQKPQAQVEAKENGQKPQALEEDVGDTASADDGAKEEEEDITKKEEVEEDLPRGLESSLHLFTPEQQALAKTLCSLGQSHLFAHWPVASATPSPSSQATNKIKLRLISQLESMDRTYPSGGLAGYIANARELLDRSRRGVNPLEGWKPSVPTGQAFDIGTEEYDKVEKLGMGELGYCGFVLVAGGLGERLGYGDIKIGLPTELASGTTYIQYYIQIILSLQSKYAPQNIKLPLCIMTSGDTNASTVKLLQDNNYFGMDENQITIVQQGDGVPALTDNDAKMALDPADRYRILAKPHGHGDVHALMYSHSVAKKWLENGIKWAVFFQDTNGLAFHTLPLALGVSSKLELVMNSMAVPRKAKQAIGGITRLENEEKKEERTINVEYNQLDPLLRASGFPDGDVNDEKTGYSPFPGNINQLLFQLEPYSKALDRTSGAMPEFVNPKYKDAEKTIFKKPTRLETMMQDFPTVLEGDDAKKVGFTSIAANLCFSPVKNATADGVALQAKGTHPGVAASGEADQYAAVREIMRSIGCQVKDSDVETYKGINVVPGPAVVLQPSFVCCPAEYKQKFPNPSSIKISSRSSLVVKGAGVTVESLELDGALVIECEEGATGVITGLVVKNKGWERVADESSGDEVIAMRGYRLEKVETKTIVFRKDGSIEGGYAPAKNATENAVSSMEEPTPSSKEQPTSKENMDKQESRKLPTTSLTEPASKEAKEKSEECGCVIQ